jgi:hypothetical protein
VLLRRAGYYAIPVIEGLAKASQQGANPLESVMDALKNDRASTITPASMLLLFFMKIFIRFS